jgi:CRP-like cAMP-binding protein
VNVIDLDVLRRAPLFDGFSDDVLERFATSATVRRYAPDDIVFVEMADADEIYLIVRGHATAERALAQPDQTFDVITVGPGDTIGEMGFVDRGQRSATVIARDELEVLVWDSATWQRICEDDPAVGYQVMLRIARVLAARLRRWNDQLLEGLSWGLP